ncbi:MAG: alpha/beta hydrolase-fold protein [Kordiimonas sp.]
MRFFVGLLFLGILVNNAMPAATARTTAPDSTPFTIELGERHILHSDILGEDRQVLVRVPESYDTEGNTSRYPVIYVLDGERHFGHASLGADILEETERMPESIIVALPNNEGVRGRDLARAQDNFRRFIGEELFAFIDNRYRTHQQKTLFGHSLAGYFTLSMLANHSDMFDNYIAASPAINDDDVAKLDQLLSNKSALPKSVFFTQASAVEEGPRRWAAVEKLAALFEAKAPTSFTWRYDYTDDQIHMTTPFLTVYPGMSFVFSDYQAPNYINTKAFNDAGGMSAFSNFFARRAAKYNVADGIPQSALRNIASLYSNEDKHEQALMLFKENVAKYPNRPRVYNSLGSGYEAAGKDDLALAAFEKAAKMANEQNAPGWAKNWFQRNRDRLKEKLANQ